MSARPEEALPLGREAVEVVHRIRLRSVHRADLLPEPGDDEPDTRRDVVVLALRAKIAHLGQEGLDALAVDFRLGYAQALLLDQCADHCKAHLCVELAGASVDGNQTNFRATMGEAVFVSATLHRVILVDQPARTPLPLALLRLQVLPAEGRGEVSLLDQPLLEAMRLEQL